MSEKLSTLELVRQLIRRQKGKKAGILYREVKEISCQTDFMEVVRNLLATGEEEEKTFILRALDETQNSETWLAAQVALSDSSPSVRTAAASLLINPKASIAWNSLVQALSDSDSKVRRNVALALMRINPVAAENLLRPLFSSPDETDRLTVLNIFKQYNCPNLTQAVIDALQDTSARVRSAAANQLCKVGKDAVAALIKAIDDPEEEVRISIMETLYKLAADVSLSTFIDKCFDSSTSVRSLALQGLAKKGNPDACPTVLKLIDEPELKMLAILTLGELGCTQALNRLLQEVQQPINENELASILKTLSKIGGNEISPILQSALLKPAPMIRAEAVSAYSKINPQQAIPVLLDRLRKDTSKMVRATAAEVLGNIGGDEVCSSLVEVLKEDSEPDVRRAAAKALSNTCAPQCVEVLLSSLTDPDNTVRLTIVSNLGKIGLEQAIPALLELEHQETNLEVLAGVAAALLRIDASRFANKVLSGSAIKLFDPANLGMAFTSWLLDPSYYPVSERVIFYNIGYADIIDIDDNHQEYRYTAHENQLHLYPTGDGRERIIKFTVESQVWQNHLLGLQKCYQLTINDDLFFNTLEPSKSTFFSTFSEI